MRILDRQAKQYEESLRHGAAIVSVHAQNEKELERAMQVLTDAGAKELYKVRPEAAVPADGPGRFAADKKMGVILDKS